MNHSFKMRFAFVAAVCSVGWLVNTIQAADPLDARPQPWVRRDVPVLSATTTKQPWCQVVLYSPHVIFHAGKFRMWYLGTSTASRSNDIAMGYAESDDGFRWKEHEGNPILTAKDISWGRFWQTPFVMYDESQFKMWFVSGKGVTKTAGKITENDQRLGYATSTDGIRWNVHPKPIFRSGRSPSVLKEGPGRYRMWMGSRPQPNQLGGIYTNIYEFTSTDGLAWKRSVAPVVRPSGQGRTVVYPFVIKESGRYNMWYGCHTPGHFELFFARSKDGTRWNTDHRFPAFPARRDKTHFDGRYTSTPCVVVRPDRYFLYYSARDMKTEYVDRDGKKRRDGAGVYAHIGVATLKRVEARVRPHQGTRSRGAATGNQ